MLDRISSVIGPRTPNCKRFTGYRPCSPYLYCKGLGPNCELFRERWLIVDLSEEGHLKPSDASDVLLRTPQIFRVLVTNPERWEANIQSEAFDLVLPYDFRTLSMLNLFRFDYCLALTDDYRSNEFLDLFRNRSSARLLMHRGKATLRKQSPYQPSCGETRILLINLGALGDVLMTTALLPVIKRSYPQSHLTWVTTPDAVPLLQNNSLIDRIVEYNEDTVDELPDQSFDLLISVDKGRDSGSLAELVPCLDKRGFGMNGNGHITAFNAAADYLYRLGLDDLEKFRINTKTGQHLLAESIGLEWQRDEYFLYLTNREEEFVANYRRTCGIGPGQLVVGINTGCSEAYPNKKLGIDQHAQIIKRTGDSIEGVVVMLLGGPSETARNEAIRNQAERFGAKCRVILTPTTEGLRRGILYLDACDALETGQDFF